MENEIKEGTLTEEPKVEQKEIPVPEATQTTTQGSAQGNRFGTKLAQADNRDLIYMLLYFVYSVIAVDFAVFAEMRMGYFISTLAFAVLSVCYLKNRKLALLPLFCLVAAVAGAAVFMLYDDPNTLFWSFVGVNLLLLTFLCLTGDISRYGISSYRFIGDLARTGVVILFGEAANAFRAVFALDHKGKKANLVAVLIGIVCALPVLLIVVPLLINADAAFEAAMSHLIISLGRLLRDILLGALLFPFLFSVSFSANKQVRRFKPYTPKEGKGISYYGVTAFLAAISLVYMAYLLSQMSYLINGFLGIRPAGFTYAEYARRGFFEMIAICVINLGLIFGVIALGKKKEEGKGSLAQKLLVAFICLFSVGLIACDFAKMVQYINSYGMTQLRIYTSVFMVMLALVFLVGMIRLFWNKMPYMQTLIVLVTLIGLAVAFTDVDTIVAKYNYQAYKSGTLSSIDVDAYGMLSDSAVPTLVNMLGDQNSTVREKARKQLERRFKDYYVSNGTGWVAREETDFRSFNVNQQRAMQLLNDNRDIILTPMF